MKHHLRRLGLVTVSALGAIGLPSAAMADTGTGRSASTSSFSVLQVS